MNPKILVVDDDSDILMLIKHELMRNGFTPVLSQSVDEAIKELSSHSFECAIIDIVMGPNQTSDEVIQFLKNASKNILNFDLPMIIISAHVTDDLRTRMISKDPLIVDAIKKPLAKNILSQKILEIISTQGEVDDELDVMFRPFKDATTGEKLDQSIKSEQKDRDDGYKKQALEEAGITELMYCCFNGDYKGLQEALIKDPDSSILSRSLDGKTCIHYAARGGNQELVDFLLVSGAKINDRDKKGHEPLYEAVNVQDIEMCKHLIIKGARVSSKFEEKTFLMIAASLNNLEIFDLFLKEGVSPNLTDDEGKTVKVYLKTNKQKDFLDLLEKNGF